MKKITLLIGAIAFTSVAFAQSQRLVLAEEFTQASCGPCAAQNPTFNTLLANNSTKVVSIKYQTSWPGVDPMNAQTQTDVGPRVTYYGVSGVPDSPMDGVEQTGAAYTGAPSNYSQAKIDAEYAVPSPFTVAVSHTFSTDYKSMTIHCTITCSQATTGTFVAQVALVEKQIHFNTAPGTNGEKDFYSVMRKMIPSASGTALAGSWTVGQSQTLNFTVNIPNFIYDMNQLAVVAFVQDNATKSVKQAGYSAPHTLPVSTLDAGILSTTNVNSIQCSGSVTPSVTIKNFATTTLTSCKIHYQLDGGADMVQNWTGSIAASATASVALPTIGASVGSHTLVSWTSNPNNGNDWYIINNYNTKKFNIVGSSTIAPITEGFVSTTFPPTGWVVDDADGNYPWARSAAAGGFGTSTNSAKANFFSDPAGNIEDLYVKNLYIPWISSAALTFDVAHSQYATESDKLQVFISDDCGLTWTSLYSKAGATLSTTGVATTASFTPSAAQWRTETLNLSAYSNKVVLIRFRATSAYGNNLYVDNINLSTVLGVTENNTNINSLNVYPNPASNNASLEFDLASSTDVKVAMYNAIGELVYSNVLGQMSAGNHKINLDAQNLSTGIYYVTLNVTNGTMTQKLVITK